MREAFDDSRVNRIAAHECSVCRPFEQITIKHRENGENVRQGNRGCLLSLSLSLTLQRAVINIKSCTAWLSDTCHDCFHRDHCQLQSLHSRYGSLSTYRAECPHRGSYLHGWPCNGRGDAWSAPMLVTSMPGTVRRYVRDRMVERLQIYQGRCLSSSNANPIRTCREGLLDRGAFRASCNLPSSTNEALFFPPSSTIRRWWLKSRKTECSRACYKAARPIEKVSERASEWSWHDRFILDLLFPSVVCYDRWASEER